MITGMCKSNLDVFRQSQGWPEMFAAIPHIGDYVTSDTGISLRVVAIYHSTYKNGDGFSWPRVVVELNK